MSLSTEESKATGIVVPLVGRIAAGSPVMAAEHVEDYLVGADGLRPVDGEHFALRVAGESMIGAGILDGDMVVIRSQEPRRPTATSSRPLLPGPAEDEATVKRLGHDGDRVMLIPENPALDALRDARRSHHGQGRRRPPQALSHTRLPRAAPPRGARMA